MGEQTNMTSREWGIMAYRIAAEIMEENPTAPVAHVGPFSLREITFWTYSAEEMKAAKAVVGADKWDKYTTQGGVPGVKVTRTDLGNTTIKIIRGDLHCEMVDTGEVEEYEAEEVVTEAVTRTVTKTRPVMERKCPPILENES